MVVIVLCVDKPLFSSYLILAFVYAIMILMSKHTHNRNTRRGYECWGGRGGGG